jgi:lipopolysaccharide/colanic/teichoic acid biosynthesis glycosyltransferase
MSVNSTVKRLVDVTFAGLALLLVSPMLAVVGLCVRINMGAPVLFRQVRAGHLGKPFTLFKFRTMRDAGSGPVDPLSDGQRLTRLGRMIRRLSFDELPQLWNVLRGDMSLVGPRPLLMQYLDRYTADQARRHEVKPGMTGWAQINGRNALTWEQKFAFDVWYVDNWTPGLDFRILARTFGMVLTGRGISQYAHATMPEFLGSNQLRPDDASLNNDLDLRRA